MGARNLKGQVLFPLGIPNSLPVNVELEMGAVPRADVE